MHYAGAHYERNVWTGADTTETVTKYYYANLGGLNRLIAFRRNGTLYYVCTDHLGGTRKVVDAQGNEAGFVRYQSYGADRESGGALNTDKKFTGQTQDLNTGLYYYGSRFYDAGLGRFVVPDTIVPDSGNPQALNRYSYGFNNPVRYGDPTGHDPVDWFDDSWIAEFRAAHEGRDPDINDYAYRYYSMAWTSGAIDGQYQEGEQARFSIPAGADLARNIRYGLVQGTLLNTSGALGMEFARLVRPGGDWDYIDYSTRMYEEFGNFNFGAAGAAWGFSEGEILRGAGAVQIAVTTFWKAVEVLSFGRISTRRQYSPGSPWGSSPYGDDASDQAAIKAGIDFYRFYSTAVDPTLRRSTPRTSYFGTVYGY